jgi:peroxiredoxin
MKLLLTALALITFSSPSVWALKVGDTMPKISTAMPNVDGKKVTFESVKGEKGTLVFFTCNHCPFSKRWEERYANFGNEIMSQGFGVIAINPNDPAEQPEDGLPQMQTKAKRLGMKFPYVVDETSDIARAFKATRTPEFFLFDQSGKLIYTGAFDDDAADPKEVKNQFLKDAVTAHSQGLPIVRSETRAPGCTIKFRKKS